MQHWSRQRSIQTSFQTATANTLIGRRITLTLLITIILWARRFLNTEVGMIASETDIQIPRGI
jgi:hypothetical protein